MGGYSLPPPNPGKGLFDSLVAVRLRRLAPTVMFCWLRAVCMRLSAVGCLLRAMSSAIVGSRDRLISSRTMEMRDPLLELVLAVSPVAECDNGAVVFMSGSPGGLAANERHRSLSASSSASSIRWSAESMTSSRHQKFERFCKVTLDNFEVCWGVIVRLSSER
jgi:hypothetical protein